VSGFATAQAGPGAVTADRPTDARPTAVDDARHVDGSNSPWATGDGRLDAFQDRFDLTDEEMTEIRTAVNEALADGADRTEVRAVVLEKLEAFGVEDPGLGPFDDRAQSRAGGPGNGYARGDAPADGTGHQHRGHGGPHGVADGTGPNCPYAA
jgi:hypothetical protein